MFIGGIGRVRRQGLLRSTGLLKMAEAAISDKCTSGQDENEEFTFFYKSNNEFSQWHKTNFNIDGIRYCCAEQYMMHQKAVLFGDMDTADKIMKTTQPRQQKSLGRKVKNFNDATWVSKREEIVRKGNIAKFSQNAALKERLLSTAGTTLVEASPFDRIWGIGLGENDPRAHDRTQWQGQNLLGKILTEVREQLRAQAT